MEPSPVQPDGLKQPTWLVILITLAILAGFGLTAFYGVRAMRSYRELHRARLHPNETDVSLIRGWMTVPYIARAYHVPETLFWQDLGIPEQGNRAKSLRTLDRTYEGGRPGVVLSRVQEIILQYQKEHPPAPTGRPGLPTSTPPPGISRLVSSFCPPVRETGRD